jgi:hypothetical protein
MNVGCLPRDTGHQARPGTRGAAAAPLPQSQARWDGRARWLLDQDGRRRGHPAGEFGRMPRSRLTGTAATLSAAGHSRWQGRTRLRRVLLRWQAPQPCRSRPGCHRGPGGLTPTSFPTRRGGVPSYPACLHLSRSCPPEGGVERPRRVVRFARLIHRRGRVLGGPSASAAGDGSLSLPWLPRRAVPQQRRHRAQHGG